MDDTLVEDAGGALAVNEAGICDSNVCFLDVLFMPTSPLTVVVDLVGIPTGFTTLAVTPDDHIKSSILAISYLWLLHSYSHLHQPISHTGSAWEIHS